MVCADHLVGKSVDAEQSVFRRTKTSRKRDRRLKPIEIGEVYYGGFDPISGRRSTMSVGRSVLDATGDSLRNASPDDWFNSIPVPKGIPGNHIDMMLDIEFEDQLEVMRDRGQAEEAEIVRMFVNNWTLKDMSAVFGLSISGMAKRKTKALYAWYAIEVAENPNYIRRMGEITRVNEAREAQLEAARKEHADYLARQKQLRQWKALKAMRKPCKGRDNNLHKLYRLRVIS